MPRIARPISQRLYGALARGFGKRVEDAARLVGSNTAAAKVMNLSTDQLTKIIAETAVPNFASIAALAERSGCSLSWLAFARQPQMSTEKDFTSDAGDMLQIPSLDHGRPYVFPRGLIPQFDTWKDLKLAAMLAPGDAMEPTIRDNGVLLVDISATNFIDGIFVFDFDGDRVVRRTQRQPGGALLLSADNANYQPIVIDPGSADVTKVLGRVIWAGGPL